MYMSCKSVHVQSIIHCIDYILPCVYNDDFKVFIFELVNSLLSYDDRVHFSVATIKRYPGLGGILFELIKRASSECVSTYQTGLPTLALIVVGKLRGER